MLVLESKTAPLEATQALLKQDSRSADAESRRNYKEVHWANELSECAQGLALARLIFNRDRGEDVAI